MMREPHQNEDKERQSTANGSSALVTACSYVVCRAIICFSYDSSRVLIPLGVKAGLGANDCLGCGFFFGTDNLIGELA